MVVTSGKEASVHTSLRVEGANCPICYSETLAALTRLDGVRSVHGSIAAPCIEVEHDDAATADLIVATVRDHLHGVELFANEVHMTPVEPRTVAATCDHVRDRHV